MLVSRRPREIGPRSVVVARLWVGQGTVPLTPSEVRNRPRFLIDVLVRTTIRRVKIKYMYVSSETRISVYICVFMQGDVGMNRKE